MDEAAITPSVNAFSGVVADETPVEVTRLEVKDKALSSIFQHPDWPTYEAVVREEIEALRSLRGLDLSGLEDAQLGQKVKQANLAAEMVESLLLKVQESAKAVIAHEQATKTSKQ
jgi:hypothetical protein